MAQNSYYYVRREMPNYAQMAQAGWNTPLFAWDDPRLAQQVAAARQAGVQYGIWGDPGNMDPAEYARRMHALGQQYGAGVLVPDLEFPYKGYEGSAGWQRNQALANEWRKYANSGMRTMITPMGWQADFNYGAWNGLVDQWMPQLYGADSVRESGIPGSYEDAVNTLLKAGIPRNQITPILARAGIRQGLQNNGAYALYTMDDELLNLPAYVAQGPGGAPRPGVEGGPMGEGPGPDGGPIPKVPDAQNPRAIAYANKRLEQLRRLGVDVPAGDDPTAVWRQMSQGVGAQASQAGFQDPRQWLRSANPKPNPGGAPLAHPGSNNPPPSSSRPGPALRPPITRPGKPGPRINWENRKPLGPARPGDRQNPRNIIARGMTKAARLGRKK